MEKLKEPPFKIGDRVTTRFYIEEAKMVRRVERVWRDDQCLTGWRVNVDGGEPCPHCGRIGTYILDLDSGWCKPVAEVTT